MSDSNDNTQQQILDDNEPHKENLNITAQYPVPLLLSLQLSRSTSFSEGLQHKQCARSVGGMPKACAWSPIQRPGWGNLSVSPLWLIWHVSSACIYTVYGSSVSKCEKEKRLLYFMQKRPNPDGEPRTKMKLQSVSFLCRGSPCRSGRPSTPVHRTILGKARVRRPTATKEHDALLALLLLLLQTRPRTVLISIRARTTNPPCPHRPCPSLQSEGRQQSGQEEQRQQTTSRRMANEKARLKLLPHRRCSRKSKWRTRRVGYSSSCRHAC